MGLADDINKISRCKDSSEMHKMLKLVSSRGTLKSSISKNEVINCMEKLVKCNTLPDDKYGDLRSSDTNVKTACQNAFLICSILEGIISHESDMLQASRKSLLPQITTLCVPLLREINPWASSECDQIAGELLQVAFQVCEISNIKAAFEQESWIFDDTLERIRPDILGDAWRESTIARCTFIYLVTNAGGDILIKSLDKILPVALTFTDDVVPRHAINGMKCINHILKEVPPAELRYRGRIEVLYDALSKKMYTRDSEIAEALMPCLILSLQCIETEMMRKRGCRIPKHDKCFDAILTNFHLSSEGGLKRIYAKSLQDFVSRMGIQVIGHMKMICIVLEYGFETSDLNTVCHLCKMVVELVNVAWLRIPKYSEELVGFLVKCLYSIENDHWRTAYVTQKDVAVATDSIVEAMARLATVSRDLVLETQTMMQGQECLGLHEAARKLSHAIGS